MDAQPLFHDLLDGQSRRQAAVGILEDDLHVLAQRDEALAPNVADFPAVEVDGALAVEQAQHGETQRGLA